MLHLKISSQTFSLFHVKLCGGVEFKMQWIKVLYTFGYTVRFWGCYKLLEHLLRFEMWIDRSNGEIKESDGRKFLAKWESIRVIFHQHVTNLKYPVGQISRFQMCHGQGCRVFLGMGDLPHLMTESL